MTRDAVEMASGVRKSTTSIQIGLNASLKVRQRIQYYKHTTHNPYSNNNHDFPKKKNPTPKTFQNIPKHPGTQDT